METLKMYEWYKKELEPFLTPEEKKNYIEAYETVKKFITKWDKILKKESSNGSN